MPRPSARVLGGPARLADRYGIVLVADEVITGFGRLGELFGSTRVGASPGHHHHGQGPHVGLRADGGSVGLRPHRGAALRRGAHAPARHHLRRSPAVRRHRAQEPRDLRARRRGGERPRPRGHAPSSSSTPSKTSPSSATSAAPGSSGRSSWSRATSNERLDADERERRAARLHAGRAARGWADRPRRRPWRRRPPDRPAAVADDAVLEEIVSAMHEVLAGAGRLLGLQAGGRARSALTRS